MGRIKTHIENYESIINDVFIETGTFKGESLEFAATLPFKELYSCDVSKRHYVNAKEKFKSNEKIKLYLESSHTLLKKIIDCSKTTTFWLDGHWQNINADEINHDATECPLKIELEHIFSFKWIKPPLILIDDAEHYPKHDIDKLKYKSGYNMNQWISHEEIKKIMPIGYNFKIRKDVIWLYSILL